MNKEQVEKENKSVYWEEKQIKEYIFRMDPYEYKVLDTEDIILEETKKLCVSS